MKGGDLLTGNEPCRLDVVLRKQFEKPGSSHFPGINTLHRKATKVANERTQHELTQGLELALEMSNDESSPP